MNYVQFAANLRFGSSRELLAVRSSELPAVRLGSSRELPAFRSELPAVRSELPENPGPIFFGSSILVVHCELLGVHTNYKTLQNKPVVREFVIVLSLA